MYISSALTKKWIYTLQCPVLEICHNPGLQYFLCPKLSVCHSIRLQPGQNEEWALYCALTTAQSVPLKSTIHHLLRLGEKAQSDISKSEFHHYLLLVLCFCPLDYKIFAIWRSQFDNLSFSANLLAWFAYSSWLISQYIFHIILGSFKGSWVHQLNL